MIFYIAAIVGCDILIMIGNIIFTKPIYGFSNLYIILCCAISAIVLIAIDGLGATLVRRCLPKKWFLPDVKIHQVGKKECVAYEKIGIKSWKDSVIELGVFTNFSKKTIADPKSLEYIEQFIIECNYGWVIHVVNVVTSFLVIFLFPLEYIFCFAIPTAIVNAFLCALPFFILRYNVNRLMRIRTILLAKENKSKNSETVIPVKA